MYLDRHVIYCSTESWVKVLLYIKVNQIMEISAKIINYSTFQQIRPRCTLKFKIQSDKNVTLNKVIKKSF